MKILCTVCDSPAHPEISVEGFVLYRCGNTECSHVYVANPPSSEELSAIYDSAESMLGNSGSWQLRDDYLSNPERIHRVFKEQRLNDMGLEVDFANGARIGEVGCSTGVFLAILSEMGADVSGYEISELQAREAERLTSSPVYTSEDDFVESGPYDALVAYAVVEHLEDPLKSLRLWRNALRPGGRIYIDVPNYDSYYRKLAGRAWIWMIPPFHLQYFCKKSIVQLLQNAGFDQISVKTVTRSSRLFILVFHLYKLLGRELTSASHGGGTARHLMVRFLETVLRIALWPTEAVAERRMMGNQLIVVANRAGHDCATVSTRDGRSS